VVPEVFAPQIGIARNKFLAYLAAGRAPAAGYRALTGDVSAFLKDLSGDVLPVSAKSKNKLHEFGLHTLGKIAALSPGPLQAQFGPEGRRIWELARGEDTTPLYPRFTEETIETGTTLTTVTVSIETVLVTLETLLARILADKSLKGRGIRSLTLWTRTWDASPWERSVRFKEPEADISRITPRLKQVLENYPQPGPVEQVGIRLTGLGYRHGHQQSLFAEVRARDNLLEDIRQLELRLGGAQVYRIKEVEPWSRLPERQYALTPLNR
jgi:DNA polymerase-4/protein ImuB